MIVSENNFFTFNSPPGPFELESFESFSLVAKGVWHETWGQFATYLDEYYYVQGFEKNWLPRKILHVNVHFTDQNHDRPGFSVFLLTPGNVMN